MPIARHALESLRVVRARLAQIEPYPWTNFTAWVASARPLFRSELGEHLSDFEKETKAPPWSMHPSRYEEDLWGKVRVDTRPEAEAREAVDNALIAAQRKRAVLAFLDGLIDLAERASPALVSTSALHKVQALIDRFELVVRALARRSHGREALRVEDEYDAQYLFGALLKIPFDEVRPEEQTPSHGGGAARIDFIVKSERLAIELKMVRATLDDRTLTDELLVDIGRYGAHPDCGTIIFFVFDPAFRLKTPRAIEHDLTGPRGGLDVYVFVRPT